MWCIPAADAEFVAQMEVILDLYERAYNPVRPLVCFDETTKQLIEETRLPLAMKPGQVQRYDYEYTRNGTAAIFMFTQPLADWRKVNVRERRTKVDWAWEIKELVDIDCAEAEKVTLVCDNLNTHTISSFYEAFPPEEARRLVERVDIHFTPKHGSWLNIAEIELSVLTRQCLDRRIPSLDALKRETNAWGRQRNAQQKTVDWQLTTQDARIKLKRLYPTFTLALPTPHPLPASRKAQPYEMVAGG